MLIEVIGTSVEDVVNAEKCGADRIELCQSMSEGGLTPSIGVIQGTSEAVDIPINVMVRPHSRSFVYNDSELETMKREIRAIKKTEANGVVLGTLTAEGKVDEDQLQELLAEAEGLEVTFHRAFDEVDDQFEALETILKYDQITTILTSGAADKALDAVPRLERLVDRTKDTHLTIMPGSGLKPADIASFHEAVGARALHFGSGVRVDGSFEQLFSKEKIDAIRVATED